MSNLAQFFPQWLTAGSEFLYPSICQTCAVHLPGNPTLRFCSSCRDSLENPGQNQCLRCSAVVGPNLDTRSGCIHCKRDPYNFHNVTGLGNYDGLLKSAILKGKLAHDSTLLSSLVDLLFSITKEKITNASTDLIIPIPHHWTDRVLSRSLASTTIANRLGCLLKVPVHRHILTKRERTPKQQSLTPTDRRLNLKTAFSTARGIDLSGAKILLVDDVLTTGTTCQRATRVLMKTGAEEVRVAVLARGIGA